MQKLLRRHFMKVVVVRSPKMLSGLLRLLFGIKKEQNI
ncbi:MAG TPA: stage V sporulation protein SpoVM [Candidatus Fimenecus excrementavium]|nr:stage V sporulation protein SpoVM [Candidatus Fimenecus excrementavium]